MESAMGHKKVQQWSLLAITWPIFIEILLHMLMGNVDTWMLGMVSDHAVASVGVANQILFSAIVMFGFVATGSSVLVAQYLGAEQRDASRHAAKTAIAMNAWFGLLISLAVLAAGPALLGWLNIPQELVPEAKLFLMIAGGFLFTEALMVTISAIARAHGYMKQMMWVTIGMNVLNVAGNMLVLFGPFALEGHEVAGVAVSTVIARVAGLLGVYLIIRKKIQLHLEWRDLIHFETRYVNRLLSIGVPSAGEQLSYQTSQLYIMYVITLLGAQALASKIYVQNITFLILLFSVSIAAGTQILIGHLIGAGRMDDAYQRGMRSLAQAIGIAMLVSVLVWWFSPQLFDLFTDDPAIIVLGQQVMLISMLLEPGRCLNLVLIGALRAAGDTKLPVIMGIASMWGVSVPLAYWFGIGLEMGLPGVYLAFAADEWLRGVTMYWRWRSSVWKSKSFVRYEQPLQQAANAEEHCKAC